MNDSLIEFQGLPLQTGHDELSINNCIAFRIISEPSIIIYKARGMTVFEQLIIFRGEYLDKEFLCMEMCK